MCNRVVLASVTISGVYTVMIGDVIALVICNLEDGDIDAVEWLIHNGDTRFFLCDVTIKVNIYIA